MAATISRGQLRSGDNFHQDMIPRPIVHKTLTTYNKPPFQRLKYFRLDLIFRVILKFIYYYII